MSQDPTPDPTDQAPDRSPGAAGRVRLVAVRDVALSVQEALDAVEDPGAGGVVSFTGLVRDVDGGRGVQRLEYVAHPDAEAALRRVCEQVAADPSVRAVAAVHRTGVLEVGEVAVVVAASAAHRGQAFEAARRLIDDLKEGVPIWKRQVFTEGDEEWVGSP